MDAPQFDYSLALQRCARGDRTALQQIYDRECRWLLGVANRIVRDRQIAEDVVQEAFISIWTRAATFDASRGSGRGWIYTVVRHRALQEVRGGDATRWVQGADLEALLEQRDIFHEDSDTDHVRLLACMEQLDAERRRCIEAAFIEGYTQHELAAVLNKPLGTIKSWISRGLLSLRECLQ